MNKCNEIVVTVNHSYRQAEIKNKSMTATKMPPFIIYLIANYVPDGERPRDFELMTLMFDITLTPRFVRGTSSVRWLPALILLNTIVCVFTTLFSGPR